MGSHNLQTRMSNNCSDIWQVLQFSTASLLDGTVVPSDGHRAIDRLTLQGTTEQMVDIGNIILQTAPVRMLNLYQNNVDLKL